ncbi:Uncharacterised protein [Mycobacteroides abscessus subsp. abscessus]|nr:Uncharacterised protein [Mycobacteroides abscessus subsp. abscessus]
MAAVGAFAGIPALAALGDPDPRAAGADRSGDEQMPQGRRCRRARRGTGRAGRVLGRDHRHPTRRRASLCRAGGERRRLPGISGYARAATPGRIRTRVQARWQSAGRKRSRTEYRCRPQRQRGSVHVGGGGDRLEPSVRISAGHQAAGDAHRWIQRNRSVADTGPIPAVRGRRTDPLLHRWGAR